MKHLIPISRGTCLRGLAPVQAHRPIAKRTYSLKLVVLVLLLLAVGACDGNAPAPRSNPSGNSQTTPGSPISADDVILAMLNNLKMDGFDSDSSINQGQGGLWVNWRYGTTPLQTNFNGTGQPDGASVNPPRHDVLTDLRYLHNLWLYKSLHPTDTQFDSEITRYTAIVKMEFNQTSNERGWLYDEFIDLYRLSKDNFYQQTAQGLAAAYDKELHQLNVGVIYKIDGAHPNGYYRVDEAIEQACALIQAGTVFNQPAWVSDGKEMIQFVYGHAYVPAHHSFLFQMDNVLLPDGKANPKEPILRGMYGHTKIDGGQVRLGEVALEILSLLHVSLVTHEQTFLDHATDLLTPLTAQGNSLGLWDPQYLGYFASATFPGPDALNPGVPQVTAKNKKESGRQLEMLEVFRVANSLTKNRYQAMQDSMLQVVTDKAYYAPGHGVLYEETSDWQTVMLKSGVPEDWVTTEAMGIALEALFSVSESNPW